MSTRVQVAVFAGERALLAATRAVRARGCRVVDVFTPYAVHGLDEAMGLAPSRLTWVCALCGAAGAGFMLWFQFWTSAVNWPIDVGGKPFNSLPAFVPITFELTVLCGGLGVVLALLARCRLWPGRPARLPAPGVTDDRFVLVAQVGEAGLRQEALRGLLRDFDPVEVREEELA